MSRPTSDRDPGARSDLELMEHADGERDAAELAAHLDRDPQARAKVDAIHQIGELVRAHLELSADRVHDASFAATASWSRLRPACGRACPPGSIATAAT